MVIMSAVATGLLLVPYRRSADASGRGRRLLPLLVLGVPALAIGLYAGLGEPGLAAYDRPQSTPGRAGSAVLRGQAGELASVGDMIGGLERRLESSPDDAAGWLLLAKSYQHLGRGRDARTAYERAKALGRNDPAVEAYLADANGTDSSAVTSIRGRVELTGDSAGEIDGSATVFIVARNANGAQTPLAVLRTPVSTLPFEFTLHDGLAMVAGNDLSSADQVIVSAKISQTGDALSTLPGYETTSEPLVTADPAFVTLALGE